jgi:hypothetical protein
MTRDVTASNKDHEQLRIWLSFLKFLLGTVALGLVTVFVNSEIQKQRLEFEIRSKENDFVAQFISHALDDNLEKRRGFAEYFVRLAPTEASRARWMEYRDYAQALVEEAQIKAAEIEEKERELASLQMAAGSVQGSSGATGTAETPDLGKKISELESALARMRRELAAIRSEPTATLAVPNVVGMPLAQAQAELRSGGFGYISTLDFGSGAPPGTVISQSPAPESPAIAGTMISMKVAGPQ